MQVCLDTHTGMFDTCIHAGVFGYTYVGMSTHVGVFGHTCMHVHTHVDVFTHVGMFKHI